jgi:Uma2 family endonuclease
MAVTAATKTATLTLEEFRALPEGPPFYEFEDGELIPMTSPTKKHQDVLGAFVEALRPFLRTHGLGELCIELDVYLPDGHVYIPDLSFVSRERQTLIDPSDQKIHGIPDLVVEITSTVPQRDRVRKFDVYYKNGVPWYWIVDSQTLAIEEYQATPQGYLRTASVDAGQEFHPRLFPGLAINLAALLAVESDAEAETGSPDQDATDTSLTSAEGDDDQ